MRDRCNAGGSVSEWGVRRRKESLRADARFFPCDTSTGSRKRRGKRANFFPSLLL